MLLVLASLIVQGCAFRMRDMTTVSRPERRTYRENRVVTQEQAATNQGALRILFTPERICESSVPITVTRTQRKMNRQNTVMILGALGLATYVTATGQANPTDEEQSVPKGALATLIALDVAAVVAAVNAAKDDQVTVENTVVGAATTSCTDSCVLARREAFLRTDLAGQAWCLSLGAIGGDNRLAVSRTALLNQARRLPVAARKEFESRPLDALFWRSQVVVPACGDRYDCNFWQSRSPY